MCRALGIFHGPTLEDWLSKLYSQTGEYRSVIHQYTADWTCSTKFTYFLLNRKVPGSIPAETQIHTFWVISTRKCPILYEIPSFLNSFLAKANGQFNEVLARYLASHQHQLIFLRSASIILIFCDERLRLDRTRTRLLSYRDWLDSLKYIAIASNFTSSANNVALWFIFTGRVFYLPVNLLMQAFSN